MRTRGVRIQSQNPRMSCSLRAREVSEVVAQMGNANPSPYRPSPTPFTLRPNGLTGTWRVGAAGAGEPPLNRSRPLLGGSPGGRPTFARGGMRPHRSDAGEAAGVAPCLVVPDLGRVRQATRRRGGGGPGGGGPFSGFPGPGRGRQGPPRRGRGGAPAGGGAPGGGEPPRGAGPGGRPPGL